MRDHTTPRLAPRHHPPGYPEPADEVIAGLTVRGRPVSRTQLARWHRAGYVPEPVQAPQGYGKGTVSFYPPGTREQVGALCGFLSRERDLERVAWRMWWAGYPVPDRYVRAMLERTAADWERFVAELTAGPPDADGAADEAEDDDLDEDLSEAAWDAIDGAPTVRMRRKLIRRGRKRAGRERFPTYVRFLFLVVGGRFTGYSDTSETPEDERQRTIVDTASGLASLPVPDWLGVGDVSRQAERTAVVLSRALAGTRPRAVLRTATEAEVRRAREQVQELLQALERLAGAMEALQAISPREVRALFGSMDHSIRQSMQALRDMSAEDEATLVLLPLVARSWGPDVVRAMLEPLPPSWGEAVLRRLFPSDREQDGEEVGGRPGGAGTPEPPS